MECNDMIDDNDIKSIYNSCSCVTEVNLVSKCDNADTKVVKIKLIQDGNEINEWPLEREYIRNFALKSTNGSGKVVINKLFVLKNAYRGKKYNGKTISRNFHEKEIEIYRKNNFIEIQLDAAWNGITHWPKLGFYFYKIEEYDQILYTLWSTFFNSSFSLDKEEKNKVISKYKSYGTIPNKYKKGFGDWLYKNKINKAFPMYKSIS